MSDLTLTDVIHEFGGRHEPTQDLLAHLQSISIPPLFRSDFDKFLGLLGIRFLLDVLSDEEVQRIEQQDPAYVSDLKAQQLGLAEAIGDLDHASLAWELSQLEFVRDEAEKEAAYEKVASSAKEQLPALDWVLPVATVCLMSPLVVLGGNRPHIASDMLTITSGNERKQVMAEVREQVGMSDGDFTPVEIAYYWGILYYVVQEDPNPLDPTVLATDHEECWQPGTVWSEGSLSSWLRGSFLGGHELVPKTAETFEWYRQQDI